jgi:hypothetical protein
VTLAAYLERLQAVRTAGGGYVAHCPGHQDTRSSLSVREKHGKILVKCFAGCESDVIDAALGLTFKDRYVETQPESLRPQVVATYDYLDEGGTLLYQVLRYVPKTFKQRRPDGSGGWLWSLGDVQRVLYRLPELRKAMRG